LTAGLAFAGVVVLLAAATAFAPVLTVGLAAAPAFAAVLAVGLAATFAGVGDFGAGPVAVGAPSLALAAFDVATA